MCVFARAHVHVFCGGGGCCLLVFNLHVKALLKALVYMILWFDYNCYGCGKCSNVLFGNYF